MNNHTNMKVIKVSKPYLKDGNSYILSKEDIKTLVDEIDTMLDYGDENEDLLIEIIEISQDQYDNLDEFTGW